MLHESVDFKHVESISKVTFTFVKNTLSKLGKKKIRECTEKIGVYIGI